MGENPRLGGRNSFTVALACLVSKNILVPTVSVGTAAGRSAPEMSGKHPGIEKTMVVKSGISSVAVLVRIRRLSVRNQSQNSETTDRDFAYHIDPLASSLHA
jgi:hypothetical protein